MKHPAVQLDRAEALRLAAIVLHRVRAPRAPSCASPQRGRDGYRGRLALSAAA